MTVRTAVEQGQQEHMINCTAESSEGLNLAYRESSSKLRNSESRRNSRHQERAHQLVIQYKYLILKLFSSDYYSIELAGCTYVFYICIYVSACICVFQQTMKRECRNFERKQGCAQRRV